jgi:hypothetical protein
LTAYTAKLSPLHRVTIEDTPLMQIATPDQRTSFVDAVKRCEVFSTQLRGVILWMQNVDPIAIQPVEEFLTTSNAVTHLFVVLCE